MFAETLSSGVAKGGSEYKYNMYKYYYNHTNIKITEYITVLLTRI